MVHKKGASMRRHCGVNQRPPARERLVCVHGVAHLLHNTTAGPGGGLARGRARGGAAWRGVSPGPGVHHRAGAWGSGAPLPHLPSGGLLRQVPRRPEESPLSP